MKILPKNIIKQQTVIWTCNNISQHYCKCSLGKYKRLQKHKEKCFTDPNFLMVVYANTKGGSLSHNWMGRTCLIGCISEQREEGISGRQAENKMETHKEEVEGEREREREKERERESSQMHLRPRPAVLCSCSTGSCTWAAPGHNQSANKRSGPQRPHTHTCLYRYTPGNQSTAYSFMLSLKE